MLHQHSPAIPRLGLAEFRTGMEGVHGASWRDHAGSGKVLPATVFPQPVGLAATWDSELAWEVGRATGLENRALHDAHPLIGLNVWAPVVNLLRDPRWGRNEEGYSEDPLLSALLGTAFGAGLSGHGSAAGSGTVHDEGAGYLLTAPTAKHFLGYNNEDFRDLTSSALRARVLHEYDLVPFKSAIEAGAVTGVMPSYNLVNGRPAHVSPLLALTREWTGDELLHCSDAWAPSNLVSTEHYFDDYPQAFAAALRAGLDSFTDHDGDADFVTGHIAAALERQLISMAEVDRAVRRKLLMRLRLGEFDPDGGPFASAGVMLTDEHQALALRAARRSAVLLRNDAGLLPLSGEAPLSVAVVGPLAATLYEDWYSPALPYSVSVAEGLAETFGKVVTHEAADRVRTSLGVFDVFDWGGGIVTLRSAGTGKYLTATRDGLAVSADKPDGWIVHETFKLTLVPGGAALLESAATQRSFRLAWEPLADGTAEAVAAAREADAAVVVVGNDPMIGGREAHDRHTLELPPGMARLVREVAEANPRTVLVIMSSYPYITPDEPPAVVWTSHAGQETGRAIAALLSGEHEFEGRLPQAWPACDADLPDALDYDIITAGWTYQYATAAPRFPFGHGLTYTTFGYGELTVALAGDAVTATLDVTNTGDLAGSEVVQLYASYPGTAQPRRRLIGFSRVALEPGETGKAMIDMPVSRLELWDVAAGRMALPAGPLEILAGASAGDIRQAAMLPLPAAAAPLRAARVAAADFDDQVNVTLIDTTRSSGTSITPADPARAAWVRYDRLDPSRLAEPAFLVACAPPAGGRIEVWLTEPAAGGSPVTSVQVPSTGGRYSWNRVAAPVPVPEPAAAVYLALHGPVRLDWFQL